MNVFGMLQVSGSALAAERLRAEVAAANMANAESTRTSEGGPYRRREVVMAGSDATLFNARLESASSQMVKVLEVREDQRAPIERYSPGHPDANAEGYVAYPDINPVTEMADLLTAVRSYQLNIAAVNASKQMVQQSLEILR
jgi:flagellar basal-body rod protein FlgC